jgi:hypothetical protein
VRGAPAPAVSSPRLRFLRTRRRVLAAAAAALIALAGLGALLVAPNRLASIRVGPLGLAWWAAALAGAVAVWALHRGLRAEAARAAAPRVPVLAPIAQAAVWASPAALLALPPLILADGTWGVWGPGVLATGAVVAAVVGGIPRLRAGADGSRPSALARRRWPAARRLQVVLEIAEAGTALLFVWAQLAAARELGQVAGWPRLAVGALGAGLVGAALLPEARRACLGGLGAALALAGLAVPLAAVATATAPGWPRGWAAAADRPRLTFAEGTEWTTAGRRLRGPSSPIVLRFEDEMRIGFGAPGRVTVAPVGEPAQERAVEAGEQLAVRRGDRLVVTPDLPVRFPAGRRVPDAPESGPDWMDPEARPGGPAALLGLLATAVLGAIGIGPGMGAIAGTRLPGGRAVQAAAALAVGAVALAAGWSLWAAWLTPEVYAGGVTGAEVYELAAAVPGLREARRLLATAAVAALGAGVLAAALGALHALPARGRWSARLAGVVVAGTATLLAVGAAPGPWPVLLAALGLAAATLGPAVVLTAWSERATASGLAAGAGAGLACFAALSLAGVAAAGGGGGAWSAALGAWPGAIGAGLHGAIALAWRSRRSRAAAALLPPGLEAVHGRALSGSAAG